jgi:hypothetical protein
MKPKYFKDGRWNPDYRPPVLKHPRGYWQATSADRKRYDIRRALYFLTEMRPKQNVVLLAKLLLAEDHVYSGSPGYDLKVGNLARWIRRHRDKYIRGKTTRAKKKPAKKK